MAFTAALIALGLLRPTLFLHEYNVMALREAEPPTP
jgi:hypothetical protein